MYKLYCNKIKFFLKSEVQKSTHRQSSLCTVVQDCENDHASWNCKAILITSGGNYDCSMTFKNFYENIKNFLIGK